MLPGVQTVNYVEELLPVTLYGFTYCNWLGLVLCPGCVVMSESGSRSVVTRAAGGGGGRGETRARGATGLVNYAADTKPAE